MKLVAVLLNFLHYFYHGIQSDKTRNLDHDETFEVQHEIYTHLHVELKRHTEYITNVKFPSNFLSMSPKLCFWR